MALVHHELCFGCGRTNLFGLLLEAERTQDGSVSGRCFIKQDHQGPSRGYAHDGIVCTALAEAMTLACGPEVTVQAMTVGYIGRGTVAVGDFLHVEAQIDERSEGVLSASARASAGAGGETVARALGTYSSAAG